MEKRERIWIFLFLLPACLIFLLFFAAPIVMLFVESLFNYRLLPKTFEFIGFANYIKLFTKDSRFYTVFLNTIAWIALQCTVHIALGSILAFILYKKPFGWEFTRVVYMIPNIISQVAIAMIFVNLYNPQYGAINSFLTSIGLESLNHNWLFDGDTAFMSVSMTWLIFAGYTTTLVLAQCLSIDRSVIEAAMVDGANSLQIDVMIVLPLVKRMIGTTVIMGATYMLKLFSMIYVTTGGGPGVKTSNLPLYLYGYMKANNYGYASAIGVIIIITGFVSMILISKIFGINKDE